MINKKILLFLLAGAALCSGYALLRMNSDNNPYLENTSSISKEDASKMYLEVDELNKRAWRCKTSEQRESLAQEVKSYLRTRASDLELLARYGCIKAGNEVYQTKRAQQSEESLREASEKEWQELLEYEQRWGEVKDELHGVLRQLYDSFYPRPDDFDKLERRKLTGAELSEYMDSLSDDFENFKKNHPEVLRDSAKGFKTGEPLKLKLRTPEPEVFSFGWKEADDIMKEWQELIIAFGDEVLKSGAASFVASRVTMEVIYIRQSDGAAFTIHFERLYTGKEAQE